MRVKARSDKGNQRYLLGGLALLTTAVSIVVRLQNPGWILLFFGIPLLLVAIVHLIVHARAAIRLGRGTGSYVRLMLLSDLFIFLGFGLQPDVTDNPVGDVGIRVSVYQILHGRPPSGIAEIGSGLYTAFNIASIAFLVGLVATWVMLWRRSRRPKVEKPASSSQLDQTA